MTAKRSNRIWGIALGWLVLSLCFYGLANVLSYFKTGAQKVSKYNLGVHQLSDHKPQTKWLQDDADIKGDINPYIREDIEKSYINAWGILNLSLKEQKDLGLKENFSTTKVAQIIKNFNASSKILREDLEHNIQLHFISLDKQVVSFTDRNAITRTEIITENSTAILRDTSSYNVVMTLQDGKWKINKFYRRAASK